MKLASFNINGIRARMPRLLEWLEREQPDVACLQELKCADEALPIADIEGAGYGAVWHGQKGFVSFPNLSGAIYLVTISEGQYRVAILNRPSGGHMTGILLTLAAGQGAQLIPAAVPLAMLSTSKRPDTVVGVIRDGDQCFAEYRECVDRVTGRGFALFPH